MSQNEAVCDGAIRQGNIVRQWFRTVPSSCENDGKYFDYEERAKVMGD